MSKKVLAAVVCLLAMCAVAQAVPTDFVNHVRPMMGKWYVHAENCSDNVTWTIRSDKQYASDSGSSQIAYGYKNPGNVEFILFWSSFVPGENKYHYYEKAHDQVNDYNDIPGQADMDQYTIITATGASASDNFTDNLTCFTKTTSGPYPIIMGSRVDNDTACPCEDNATACELKRVIPSKLSKIVALVAPIVPIIVIAGDDTEFERGDKISVDSDAIMPLIQIRLGKKMIIALSLLRFGKLESGDVTVTAKECTGTITVR